MFDIRSAQFLTRLRVVLLVISLALLVSTPVVLSNSYGGTILGFLSLFLLFFFPGYLLLTFVLRKLDGFHLILSVIFGLVSLTTAFDAFDRALLGAAFSYLVAGLSAAGIILLAQQSRSSRLPRFAWNQCHETIVAGCAAAWMIAPVLWRSGRFSGNEFVFYGPAGKDPLFHITLLRRLLLHAPPDNFIMSGLRAPAYHYFDDLSLAFILRTQHAWHLLGTNLFDLYFRCYPTLFYFLLGALAFRVGKQLAGTIRGGILGTILLLGGGGLGWFLGGLQTLSHTAHFVAMRESLFSAWTSWDGVDAILPLVHRPAHYNGLLISLSAITILLEVSGSRRDWALAGLLLGLLSGFNFTLAATFGVAAVFGTILFALKREKSQATDLLWLASFIFIGSLPVLVAMLLSGLHNNAPGLPFRGPNLEFPRILWGSQLAHLVPLRLVPWAALIVLPIFAYGFRLCGLRALARLDLGDRERRSVALLLGLVFSASLVIGVFFPYNAFGGGTAIIFVQPTIWILGLFAIRPLDTWLGRERGHWYAGAVWCVLGLTWLQALASFNFSQRAEFDEQTTRAFEDIHAAATSGDVVAYLPSGLIERPLLGAGSESTNFAVMAMTGLDGYFSNQTYSIFFAVPGLNGASPAQIMEQAEGLYEQRLADVNSFLRGDITPAALARLERDHVRWIVASREAMHHIACSTTPWRTTPEIVIYRLTQGKFCQASRRGFSTGVEPLSAILRLLGL
jgi:hypothetical protein